MIEFCDSTMGSMMDLLLVPRSLALISYLSSIYPTWVCSSNKETSQAEQRSLGRFGE